MTLMAPESYRQAIARLGLGVLGAGRFFGISRRTARRWAAEGPPQSAAMLLVVMDAAGLSPAQVARWMWARGMPIGLDVDTGPDVGSDGVGDG